MLTFDQLLQALAENQIKVRLNKQGELLVRKPNNAALNDELLVAIKHFKPQLIERLNQSKTQVDKSQAQSLSLQQQSIWFQEAQTSQQQFLLHTAIALAPDIDTEKLLAALKHVYQANDILQLRFFESEQQIYQQISLRPLVISTVATENSHEQILQQQQAWLQQNFDFNNDVLFQTKLFTNAGGQHLLLLKSHHLLVDAQSLALLWQQLLDFYYDKAPTLPQSHYLDYAASHHKTQAALTVEAQEPLSFLRTASRLQDDAIYPIDITNLQLDIKNLAKAWQVSTFSIYLGAALLTLSRFNYYSVFNYSVVSSERSSDFSDCIGLFTALKTGRFNSQNIDNLKSLCQTLFKQNLSPNNVSNAISDFVISYNQGQADTLALKNQQSFTVLSQTQRLKYPFLLAINETDNAAEVAFYADKRFEQAVFLDIADSFYQNLKALCKHNENATLALLPKPSYAKSLGPSYPLPTSSVASLIGEQAKIYREKTAISLDDKSISYQALIEQAQHLAVYFNTLYPNSCCIALHLPRSIEGIIAMLAVSFSRHFYCAIDPNLPIERKQLMLSKSDSSLLISEHTIADGIDTLSLDELAKNAKSSQGQALIERDSQSNFVLFFTSGSTGEPKACVLKEPAMLNRLLWMQQAFNLSSDDAVLQKTSHSFDVSVWEIFWPLMFGGKLVLAKADGEKNPEYLSQLAKQQNISICHFVPSLLQAQLHYQAAFFNNLRLVISSGEKLNIDTAKQLLEQNSALELYNLYGPTEAAIDVSFQEITLNNIEAWSQLPIGHAINNCELRVFGENLQSLPAQCSGQLAISGTPLAEGYYKNQALTDEKFVYLNDNGTVSRFYLTGDLAFITDEGQVFYQQRLDQQVKIRGVRIELEEISQQALQRLAVKQAACLYFTEPENLVLFYQGDEALEQDTIYQCLSPILLPQALPTQSLHIEHWPINAQGKTDKQKLRQLFLAQQNPNSAVATSNQKTDLLNNILSLWQGYFKQPIKPDDNFFALGGHSLLAMQFMHELQQQAGISGPAQLLYQFTSPQLLADNIGSAVTFDSLSTTNKASPAQALLFSLHQNMGSSVHYHMPGALEISGPLQLDFLQKALQQTIEQCDVLHQCFMVEDGILLTQNLNPSLWQSDIIDGVEDSEQQLKTLWQRPFDLQHDYPIRVHIIKLSQQKTIVSFCLHHIAGDAKSLQLLATQVLTRYQALLTGQTLNLPQAASFAAFSHYCWQHKDQHLGFWQQHLHNSKALQLPHDRQAKTQSVSGSQLQLTISSNHAKDILALCQRLSISPFVYFLSCYQLLLHRLSLQDDFSIALALDGRDQAAFANVIGYCVNTVALRLKVNKAQSIEQFLQKQQLLLTEVLQKQHVDSAELLKILQRQQGLQQKPKLPDAGFNFLSDDSLANAQVGDLQIKPLALQTGFAKLKLNCIVSETASGFTVSFEHQSDFISSETVSRWLQSFNNLSQCALNEQQTVFSAVFNSDKALAKRVKQSLPNSQSFLPLTPMQQDLYLASLLDPEDKKHYPGFATLSEADADLQLWQSALWQLYQHNNTLRSSIYTDASQQSYQVVLAESKALFNEQYQQVASSKAFSEEAMQQTITELCYRPYTNGKLFWRAQTTHYPCGKKLFIFTGHHALFDGVSMQAFGQLLKDNYQQLAQAQAPELSNNNFEDYSLNISATMNSLQALDEGSQLSQRSQNLLDFTVLAKTPKNCQQQYRLSEAEVKALKLYCRKNRTTIPHFYKSLFALTIALEHCFDGDYVFAEVISGRTAKNFLVQGVLFEQQVNSLNLNHCDGTFSQLLKLLAKERKQIKLRGALSFSRQYSLFKNQLGFVFNYYLMQSETEFLGKKERVQHLIPKMHQPSNLVISEINQSLVLQLFYQQADLQGQQFFQRMLQIQQAILAGHNNFSELLINTPPLYFNLPDNSRLETGDRLAIEPDSNGQYFLQSALGTKASENMAGQLIKQEAGVSHSLPVYAIVQNQQLHILGNQRIQQGRKKALKIPPRNQLEQDITAIWQQVLAQDNIGIHDNFFALGGHSLHALRINYLLEEQFGIALAINRLFQQPTIAGLCEAIFTASIEHQGLPALNSFAPQASYPLSQAQFRLWLLDKIQGHSSAYIIEANIKLLGQLNTQKMKLAFNKLLAKHPSLRLSIFEEQGEPRQKLLALEFFDLQLYQNISQEEFFNQVNNHRPTLQNAAGLIQAHLLQISAEEFQLALRIHHIICDADSLAIMAQDLLAFYQNAEQAINQSSFFYGDYSLWQQQLLESTAAKKATDFWLNYLDNVPVELGLKNDHPRESLIHVKSQTISWQLPAELLAKLDAFCQNHGISRFMLLLLCYQVSLARHSGNQDISVGITRNARFSEQLQQAVGFYINILIIRQRFNINLSLADLIDEFSQQLLRCYQYEYLPAEQVIQALKLERRNNLLPVVQAAFNYMQQASSSELQLADVQVELLNDESQQAKFEWLLNAIDSPNGLKLELEYHQGLFEPKTIESFLGLFKDSLYKLLDSNTQCSYQLLYPEKPQNLLQQLDQKADINYWQKTLQQSFLSLNGGLKKQSFTLNNYQALQHLANKLQLAESLLLNIIFSYLLREQQATSAAVLFIDNGHYYCLENLSKTNTELLVELAKTIEWQKASQQFLPQTREKLFGALTAIATKPCDTAYISLNNSGLVQWQLPEFLTIDHLARRVDSIIEQLQQGKAFSELCLLLDFEKTLPATTSIAKPDNILTAIFNQTEINANKLAVVTGAQSLSYQQLASSINRYSQQLLAQGIGPGKAVAVALDKNIELIPLLLAVIQVGATYIPLDLQYPDDRLAFMLDDAKADLLVTLSTEENRFTVSNRLYVDDLPELTQALALPTPDAEQIIYRLYTSGSTGNPKAALVYRHSFELLLQSYQQQLQLAEHDKLLVISALGFDLTQKNLFVALTTGATVVLHDSPVYDPSEIAGVIDEQNISIINCAPSAFYPLIEIGLNDKLTSLRCVLFGGEPIALQRLAPWVKQTDFNCQLVNMYGPTECTDISTSYLLNPVDIQQLLDNDGAVPLGKPYPGVSIDLCNEQLQRLPLGFIGEICISGASVGAGYWQRDELTNAHFVEADFAETKLYKTGDLAQYRQDANGQWQLYYIGRKDFQVKLHGLRIELGDIEQALQKLPDVRDSYVLLDNEQLLAFVLTESVPQNWREQLAQYLPSFMLPSQCQALEKWPLTANGKIDRKALLALKAEHISQQQYLAPRSDTEHALAELWQEVLGVGNIGIHENFFEAGGDSLAAVRLIARIELRFEIKLPVASLFSSQTIAALAHEVEQQTGLWSPIVPIQTQGDKTPIFAVHALGGMVLSYEPLSRALGQDQPFYGVQALGFEPEQEPFDNLQAMAEFYCEAILQTQVAGPYQLLGHSFGGLVAIEIAKRLQEKGHEVCFIGLVDSYLPMPLIRKKTSTANLLKLFLQDNVAIPSDKLKQLNTLPEAALIKMASEQLNGAVSEQYLQQSIAVMQHLFAMQGQWQNQALNLPIYFYAAKGESLTASIAAKINRYRWQRLSHLKVLERFDENHWQLINSENLANKLTFDLKKLPSKS